MDNLVWRARPTAPLTVEIDPPVAVHVDFLDHVFDWNKTQNNNREDGDRPLIGVIQLQSFSLTFFFGQILAQALEDGSQVRRTYVSPVVLVEHLWKNTSDVSRLVIIVVVRRDK